MSWIQGALNETITALRRGAELRLHQGHIATVRYQLEMSYQGVSTPDWAKHKGVVLELAEQVGELASLCTKLGAAHVGDPIPVEVEEDYLVGSLEIYASTMCPSRDLPDRARGAYCKEYYAAEPTPDMKRVLAAMDTLDALSDRADLNITQDQLGLVHGVQKAIRPYLDPGLTADT